MANILHISRTMDIGGAERIVYQLATDLKEEFENVHVASTGGLWEEELNKNGIKHHKILDVESKSPKTLATNFNTLRKIIKENKIDIIHTHHRMAAFYARLLMYIFPEAKHIYTAHNIFDNKIKMYKYSLKGAKVIAVSIAVKEHLKKQLGLNEIEIIYNGIKINNSKETLPEIKNFTGVKIGYIGRLDYQKGVDLLIESLVQLDYSNYKLYLVGKGDMENELKTLVFSNLLSTNVEFLGYRDDISELINSFDFLVFPSRFEGFGLALAEAFLHEKTAVVTNILGFGDLIDDNNSVIVEPENIEDIARGIELLINNEEKREALGKMARVSTLDKIEYSRFLKRYSQEYTNMRK